MKKLLFTLILAFSLLSVKAQLTFEHKYDTGSTAIGYGVHLVHFSAHNYLYVMANCNAQHGMVELYNLNHTLYKQFAIPPQQKAGINGQITVCYVSDSLFNTNPVNFEYLIYFSDTATYFFDTRVYDEAGNLIFSRDSVGPVWGGVPTMFSQPVQYSSAGYKIVLQKGMYGQKQAYVYGLPGALPCSECANSNIITAIDGPTNNSGNNGFLRNAYPNPAKHSVTIPYQLPEGINTGQIVFYDLQGKEIKQIPVGRAFTSVDISVSDIAAGTYLYILRTSGGDVGSKKMVIIK